SSRAVGRHEQAADRPVEIGPAANVPTIVGADPGVFLIDDLAGRANTVAALDRLDVLGVDDLLAVLAVAAVDAGPVEDAAVGITLILIEQHIVRLVQVDHLLSAGRQYADEDKGEGETGFDPHGITSDRPLA